MFARTVLLIVPALLAAQPPARLSFEVASVKPAPGCRMRPGGGPSAGRLELPCMSIRTMIRMAYGGFTGERLNARTPEVVGGPSWLDTEMYALSAKTEGTQSAEVMMGPMMQSLLEERLQLKVHTEQRETPSYSLVVAKNPPKLIPAKEGSCVSLDLNSLPKQDLSKPPRLCGVAMVQPKDGVRSADVPGATMEEFAGRFLSPRTQRPVIDKTGIAGRFDIHLEYSPVFRSC